MRKVLWFGWQKLSDAEFAAFLAHAKIVKQSAVRTVYTDGRLFLKHDRRLTAGFYNEYANASYLEKLGLPVVRHLAFGYSLRGHYLLTEALPGAVETEEYIFERPPDADFLDALVALIVKMEAARVIHRDWLPQNILYQPAEKRCTLVDVHAVKRRPRPAGPAGFGGILTYFRPYLDTETLARHLAAAGVPEAEKRARAAMAWPWHITPEDYHKRRGQILSGYPKFTRLCDGLLLDRYARAEDLAAAVRRPGGEREFLHYYFLRMAGIPPARVFGFDPVKQELLTLPDAAYAPVTPELFADYRARAAAAGMETVPEDWRCDAHGRAALFNLHKSPPLPE